MAKKKKTKFIHTDRYVAEVDVEVELADQEWAPYLSVDEVKKLELVKKCLESGDLKPISGIARVFEKKPVEI